jgi:hypothetical protein
MERSILSIIFATEKHMALIMSALVNGGCTDFAEIKCKTVIFSDRRGKSVNANATIETTDHRSSISYRAFERSLNEG